MSVVQSRNSLQPCASERVAPLARQPTRRRLVGVQGRSELLTVAALVVPVVAVGVFKLLRRGRRRPATRTIQAKSLPDGAVPATDSLDALGLQPSLAPSAGAQPPEPLPLVLFDANIGCSLQQLFRIIMGPDAVFIKAQHARHKYWDVSVGEWAKHADGRITRRICFTTPLKGSFGPKQADCVEEYSLEARSADGFHVTMMATTPNVPYGGSFYQDIQFLAQSAGAGGCHLRVTAEVQFTKRVMGIGGIIRSSATQGMQETYSTYMDSIQEVLRQPPAGGSASGNGSADAPAAAAAAEAAVNGSQPPAAKSVRASAQTAAPLAMPPASGKAAPANLAGSPYAQQLWQRWFRDALTAALLAVSLWLMRRAIDGAADSLAAAGGGVTGDPPGFWQGRRMVFRHGSLLPLLQATPQAQ